MIAVFFTCTNRLPNLLEPAAQERRLFRNKFAAAILIGLALILLGAGRPALARGAAFSVQADQQLAYAEHYYDLAHYFRAITEYQRFLFFFPEDARQKEVRFKIGMAYYHDRDYGQAVASFSDFTARHLEGTLTWQAYLMLSLTYEALNMPGQALTTLKNLLQLCDDAGFRDEAHYRLGWLSLDMQLTEQARTQFGLVENTRNYPSEQLLAELADLAAPSRKHPWLAGLLGIIPGAGYAYCERWQDAAVALVLNGALILATIESFDQGHAALGSLLGLTAVGFYTGSIYGSVSAAHKYNAATWQKVVRDLRDRSRLQLSLRPDGRLQLGWALSF